MKEARKLLIIEITGNLAGIMKIVCRDYHKLRNIFDDKKAKLRICQQKAQQGVLDGQCH